MLSTNQLAKTVFIQIQRKYLTRAAVEHAGTHKFYLNSARRFEICWVCVLLCSSLFLLNIKQNRYTLFCYVSCCDDQISCCAQANFALKFLNYLFEGKKMPQLLCICLNIAINRWCPRCKVWKVFLALDRRAKMHADWLNSRLKGKHRRSGNMPNALYLMH